ncbi:MAG TPA: zf-HC2 domain-containing protein [Anaeromyxobacteraceae bacterium]|nr:zf-HC2 domain-containing protein [Anaeromyxobacteraceae bacterium]
MSPCHDLDALIAARASGDLDPEDTARLEAHLPSCERCRAELAACTEVLALVRLDGPAPSPVRDGAAAKRVGRDLGRSVLLRLRLRRRRFRVAFAGGLSVAAAAALVMVVSLHGGHPSRAGLPSPAEASAAAGWEPDVEGALEVSALGEADSQDDSGSTDTELAALEASDLP